MDCGKHSTCVANTHFNMTCECKPGFHYVDETNTTAGCRECATHNDCPESKMCVSDKCHDLCNSNICGANSTCHIENNQLSYKCIEGHFRDDSVLYSSPCHPPECTGNSQCGGDKICHEGKCVGNPCKLKKCGPNTQCIVSMANTAVCMCNTGFYVNPSDKDNGCVPSASCERKPEKKKRFKIHPYPDNNVTWEEAYEKCVQENMTLATVRNEQEQLELKAIINREHLSWSAVWLGGRYKKEDGDIGDYFWVVDTDEQMSHTNWRTGYPYKVDGTVNCVGIVRPTYKWIVLNCGEQRAFVCEFFAFE